jgi:hypothetical protein
VTADDQEQPDRHGRLLAVKLRAVVAGHLGREIDGEIAGFAPGAALLTGDEAWLLVDDDPAHRLGACLGWWRRRPGLVRLHLVAERDAGVLSRRIAQFAAPVSVWALEGRTLTAAQPASHVAPPDPPASHWRFAATIEAAGAEVAVDAGAIIGEVAGLEVCRVVDDPYTGVTRLEVGAGRHDREAFQLMHGDSPDPAVLAGVVAHVAQHRRVGASPHPFNRVAAERFVRWRLVRDPALVGAVVVHAVEPTVPRAGGGGPAVAEGERADGTRLVVACSQGIDLELIPDAADARHRALEAHGPIDLTVVTAARDRAAITTELAALLRQAVSFVSLD